MGNVQQLGLHPGQVEVGRVFTSGSISFSVGNNSQESTVDLPFSSEQFFDAFRGYNTAVWPMQWLLNSIGLVAVALLWQGRRRPLQFVSLALVLLWLWCGIVYHFLFFAPINPAAWLFGALFVAQGVLFLWKAIMPMPVRIGKAASVQRWFGWSLITYAILIYPALGFVLGHRYPHAATFGLPCPTTIFTIGVLMVTASAFRRSVFIVPILWCVVGSVAAFELGVWQDLGLIVAGAGALIALIVQQSTKSAVAR